MVLCKKHDKISFLVKRVRGLGYCSNHGYYKSSFVFLKEPCPQCALEKKVCQVCGEKIKGCISFAFVKSLDWSEN